MLNYDHIELVNHSYNHYRMEENSKYSNNYFLLRHEIVDADKYFEKLTGTDQICFVCPENQMCTKGYTILENNGFYAVRRGTRDYNSLSPEEGTEPGQWFNLCCMGIMDDGVDSDVRNGWVDYAVENHVWLIEMWHNVKFEDDGNYQTIEFDEAEEHISYIENAASEECIWVATYTEATKYIRERQNASVYSYIIDNELHVYVELNDSSMSYDVFDQPLTVAVFLPSTEVCYFDVVPGNELIINLD